MTIKEIQELIKLLDKSELAEFHFKNKDVEVKIRSKHFNASKSIQMVAASAPMASAPAPMQIAAPALAPASANEAPAAPAAKSNYIEVKSPMVGTFYRSSGPDKGPFVSVGDSIQKGSVVCIIEAMKLFNEIESEVTGTIVKVMVEDAAPVEYDQVLFLVEP